MRGGVVGKLESVLDVLAAEGLDGLVAPQLLDRTAELVRARNRIDAELTRTVRRCEVTQAAEHDGLTSMAAWLRGHVRLSAGEVRRLVGNGRVLAQLPTVAAGFAAGAVTAEQVAVVTAVAKPENVARAAEQGVDLAAVGGEKLCAALESVVQADRPAGDRRTRAQRLGDALVQLADTLLAAGTLPVLRTVTPHVLVTIDIGDLADPGPTPAAATTGFGATLSAARARWLACDAGISRIVFGPDGAPTELGRTHRVVPPHLRRAVEVRDRHCVFTGCAAPTHWCDVHHLVHWIDDGETNLDNSALLCERHHTKVHSGSGSNGHPTGDGAPGAPTAPRSS
jgi:hypothetical protein